MNIYDIAELAGVSIATVSRVLSGNPKVRPETRKKVEEVMNLNGYAPSLIARGMNSKSLKTVAVVVLNFENSHHMRIAHEILKFFSTIDYNVVIYEAGTSIDDILNFLMRMKEISIDGIILVSSVFTLLEKNYEQAMKLIGDKPVIIANGWIPGMYGIVVDEDVGCYEAVENLIAKGIKRIYFINSTYSDSYLNKYRGYSMALAANGLEEHSIQIKEEYSEEDINNALDSLVIVKGETAILCDEDVLAVTILSNLKDRGISIPQDISIVGYNNSSYCNLTIPHLSSIDNQASILGQKCAEYLSNALKNKGLGEKRILEHIKSSFVSKGSSI